MNLRMTSAVIAIAVGLSAPLFAQDRSGCVNSKDHIQAIKACSELIRSHPKDAAAYHLRGDALAKNGDLGQAIADYNRAIQIDPNYAPAYNSRANAFVAKGDYAHAVADVTKAGEITTKAAKQVKAQAAARPKSKMASRVPAKVEEKKGQAALKWVDGRPSWQ